MFKIRIEVNGQELDARQRDTMINALLIDAVSFLIGFCCAQGWLAAPLIWGALAISLVNARWLSDSKIGMQIQLFGLWIYLLAETYTTFVPVALRDWTWLAFAIPFVGNVWWNIRQRRGDSKTE